jgi:arginase
VHDRSDTPRRRWSPDRRSPLAQNVAEARKTVDAVRRAAVAALDDGEFPLVFGGDCTVGIGSAQALAERSERGGLVYLDLDADLNTPEATVDGALD